MIQKTRARCYGARLLLRLTGIGLIHTHLHQAAAFIPNE